MSKQNQINDIRPTSVFGTYAPSNENQTQAALHLSGLAQSLIDNQQNIKTGPITNAFDRQALGTPFPAGIIMLLHGTPGTGKTHLLEAFVNQVRQGAPELLNHIYLNRGALHYPILDGSDSLHMDYGYHSIIIVDDLYANKQSLQELNSSDYTALSGFLTMVYEKRCLAILSSNFSLKDGLAEFIAEYDKVGRISSRVQELVQGRGISIDTSGPDYRQAIAARGRPSGPINPFAIG